ATGSSWTSLDVAESVLLLRWPLLGFVLLTALLGGWLAQHEGHLTEFAWIFGSIIFWAGVFIFLGRWDDSRKIV
ncbi:unnamed protein product, partial [Polarella glacialis]